MSEPSRSKRAPIAVGAVVLAALTAGGGYWWFSKHTYETTDNAFVQADTVTVAPLIEGYVAEVLVSDNEAVQAGQVVVRIDPATIRTRLAQAEANALALDAAVRSVDDKARLEAALISQRQAGVSSAQASERLARAELGRYESLVSRGWSSTQRIQSVRAGAEQATAAVSQAQAALAAEQQAAKSLDSERAKTLAQAQAARALVDQARIDLTRTEIRAPIAGVVGARAVRPGQYVRAGSALMSVVPLGRAYVVANFKETQVSRLRLGQPVEIRADAFGSRTIRGTVESFSPATGSEFALIPVENAVGNFTKIAQRLPVRIAIDPRDKLGAALRPGLSVDVKVNVTQDTGPGFADAASATMTRQAGLTQP